MLTFLAFVGRLASPLLALMPGISPKLMMWLAGLFLALVVIGGPAGVVWLNMRGEVKAAVATERGACDLAKAESEAASARAIADILSQIEDEPDADGMTGKQLCAGSPFCRDKKK